jgi:hypothetical protein
MCWRRLHAKQCGLSSIFQLYGSRLSEAVAEYFCTMFGGGDTGRFRTRRILKPKTALLGPLPPIFQPGLT